MKSQELLGHPAMELTEDQYRSIFENAVEGIFVLSPEGDLVQANPALARIFGYASPEALCAACEAEPERLHGGPKALETFLRRARQGSARALEAEVTRQDGTKIWVARHGHAVVDETGEVLSYQGTLEDITERKGTADALVDLNAELQATLKELKETQQQVIQQERLRALGQMASGIAHDFNNTLVPIIGFSELLLVSPKVIENRDRAAAYLQTIHNAAQDAAGVIARMRHFYKADKGEFNSAPVDLKALAEKVLPNAQSKWKARGAKLEVALELEPVPMIAGDEGALREALANLISNAADAMMESGTLTLRTRRDDERVSIEVVDTGIGMSEEVRGRCLEPFFSTKGDRATGLGLSMVFGIVRRHGGSLDFQSEVGHGSTFRLSFPVLAAVRNGSEEKPAPAPTRALRVLVVDDEALVRDTLSAVLVADGHEVYLATDGDEALEQFIASKFDLVVTDKTMPKVSGDQLAAAIKQVSPTTPVILLTGFGLFHEKSEFPSVDVLASKPVQIRTLRAAIAEATQLF